MPFSLKVPLYTHVWSECIPCFCVKKKRTLLGEESSFLLGYPDSNQERQDQNLQCYHYTIAQSINQEVISLIRAQSYNVFFELQNKIAKKNKIICILRQV